MNRTGWILAVVLVGCGYNSPYMKRAAQPLPPSQQNGVVVFVRPSSYADGIGATIVDEQGHFVGDAAPHSHFAVAAAPGRHLYIVWAENTDAVEIDVAPGKTYFVEVGVTPGWFSAQMYLSAMGPASKQWPRRDEWIQKTDALEPDPQAGQAYLDRRSGDVQDRVRRGREHIEQYRQKGDAQHFLNAGEGV